MLSFDTNILVYAADRQAGWRHADAARLLEVSSSGDAVLNDQSLVEFLHVMTRKRKQPLPDAASMVRAWCRGLGLITAPATVVEDTLSLLTGHKLSIWDAHMIAICAANGCNWLLSEDLSDGALYGEVRVLNPFNPRNFATIESILSQ